MSAPATMVVVAEDDDEDYLLCESSLLEAGVRNPIFRCADGEELMAFLKRPDARPDRLLLLLDLRMPKKTGWEALREIKADPMLRRMPVLILTTSKMDLDVTRAYDLGANAFLKKPLGFEESVALARAIQAFWLQSAELPRA
jgi:two-component system, response regulator